MNVGFTSGTRETLAWIRDNGPVTGRVMQRARHLPEATAFAQLRRLRMAGYLEQDGHVVRHSTQRTVYDAKWGVTEAGREYLESMTERA